MSMGNLCECEVSHVRDAELSEKVGTRVCDTVLIPIVYSDNEDHLIGIV